MENWPPHGGVRALRNLASVALAFCSATAQAVVPVPTATPPFTQVTIAARPVADEFDPHVDGNLATYTFVDDNLVSGLVQEVRYFDFSTSLGAVIPRVSEFDLTPGVSGSRIAFTRVLASKLGIFVFDTTTLVTTEVDPAPATDRLGVAIGGDRLAYVDLGVAGDGSGEIVVHDMTTGASTRLTTDTIDDRYPDVSESGAVVTWVRCPAPNACDISQAVKTSAAWVVSTTSADPSAEFFPSSNGSVVAFVRAISGSEAHIFLRPVGGGSEVQLEIPGSQEWARIAGDYIVLTSVVRPASPDLFVYDTLRNSLFQITNTPTWSESQCDIAVLPDGRVRLVWRSLVDTDPTDGSIYAATLSLPRDEAPLATGHNNFGQVGDQTLVNRASYVQAGALGTVTAVAGGKEHSLALLSDGTVRAFGRNDAGQLGDGTNSSSATPVKVSGLSGVTAIAAGDQHSLALLLDGTVWAWGSNNLGQLGDGTQQDRWTPVRVWLSPSATGIAAGAAHSLAISDTADVFAWGANQFGQLGDHTNANSATPVQALLVKDVISVAARGGHSLALERDGSVWSWGLNDHGQLGDGSNADRATPAAVRGLVATAIAAGGAHSLALSPPTFQACPSAPCPPRIWVYAWGSNASGQLGDGSLADSNVPVISAAPNNMGAIAAGDAFSLAKRLGGSLFAWGENGDGQLGDGTNVNRTSPVLLSLSRVGAIAGGGAHSLASGRRGECADGIDNDGDGKRDYQASTSLRDFGCTSLNDVSEIGTVACDDGFDNDGDGRIDYRLLAGTGDLGCSSHRSTIEAPQCQDGIDNDLQPGVDFDGGASANGGVPLAGADPQCTAPTGASEAPVVPGGGCGIGPELALLLPLLGFARARRRRLAT